MNPEEIILEQYKLYVESTDRISARREQTGRYYTIFYGALLAGVAFLLEKNVFSEQINAFIIFLISLFGIVVSITWYLHIESFRKLLSGRFKIIHDMETKLPYAPYTKEWEVLKEGKNNSVYMKLSVIEKYSPIIIAIPFYFLIIVSSILMLKALTL